MADKNRMAAFQDELAQLVLQHFIELEDAGWHRLSIDFQARDGALETSAPIFTKLPPEYQPAGPAPKPKSGHFGIQKPAITGAKFGGKGKAR